MDGTLTQTNRLIFDSFNYIARKYAGKEFTDQEIVSFFGPPEEGALAAVVGKECLAEAMTDYLQYYRKHHKELAQLFPGIEAVLSYIKEQGRKLAIFTGKGVHTTTITMDEFGIRDYFDLVVTGNDVAKHKPSAEGIQTIMRRFGLVPEEVLMVGDSVADVKAAHEAGVKIAAVLWDSYGKEKVLKMETDYVFHDVRELHEWLRKKFEEG